MRPRLVNLRETEDITSAVREAADQLRQGALVGLPTETVYGVAANAADGDAIERLLEAKRRPTGKPLTLALHSRQAALAFCPDMGALGLRVSKRCWPGPLTVVVVGGLDQGAGRELPENVRQAVSTNGDLGIRIPGHWAALEVLRLAGVPVVLTSGNRSGDPDPWRAEQVADTFGAELDLILDDGQTRHCQSSTVVRIDGDKWEVLREGVVSAATVKRLATCVILFVCTGNTCRSPMAETICKHLLAEELGCRPEGLEEQGYCVLSAGVSALQGCPISEGAVGALREMGLKPDGLGAQPLTAAVIEQCDQVWVMTDGHRRSVQRMLADPAEADKVKLLDPTGDDIPDPIGGSIEVYRACAQRIRKCIHELLPKLTSS